MPNRYNQLLQPQEYVSQYIPLPLDLINQAGAAKQKAQDEGVAETEKFLDKQWNRLSVDAPNARALKEKHDARLNEFSSRDFSDQAVKSEWSKAKREMANDFGLDGAAGAQESNYNQYIAKEKDLNARLDKSPDQGGISATTKNYIMRKALDEYNAKGGIGEKKAEGYNSIQFDTPVANPDISKQVLDATVGWKEQVSKEGSWANLAGKQWATKYSKDISEISAQEIHDAILPYIMQKPENRAYAKQQVDATTYGYDVPQAQKDKMYVDFFTKPVEASMARLGHKDISVDEDIKSNEAWLYDYKNKAENSESNKTTSSQSEAISTGNIPDLTHDMEFDEKGNLKASLTGSWVPDPGAVNDQGVRDPNAVKFIPGGKVDVSKSKENVDFIVNLQKKHPELAKMSNKEVVNAYRQARQAVMSESIPLESVSNVAAKNIGEELSRNRTQRNYSIMDDKGVLSDVNYDTVKKKLGISDEEFDKQLKEGISGYTQGGKTPGAYYIEISTDGGDKKRRVMISPDTEVANHFKASFQINNARQTLDKVLVSPYDTRPDIKIAVNPVLTTDANGHTTTVWEYSKIRVANPEETDPSKVKVLESEKTTLDDIRKEEREAFSESNYLGSKTGVLKDNTTY